MLQEIPKGIQLPINEGVDMINAAIRAADKAKADSDNAVSTANQAMGKSDSTQDQLDQVVIGGDSSVEAAQARVDAEGNSHDTLKQRTDSQQIVLSASEPAKSDIWYEDLGEAPINFNTGSGVSVANAITSDTEPSDTNKLWFDVIEGSY